MSVRYTTTFRPRFSDFDLQGVLHSKSYLDYLAEARLDQLERCYRLPISGYLAKNQSFVVHSYNIVFVRPITYGIEFSVSTSVQEIAGPTASVEFAFHDQGHEAKVYASGRIGYVLFDLAKRRPVPFEEAEKSVYLCAQNGVRGTSPPLQDR